MGGAGRPDLGDRPGAAVRRVGDDAASTTPAAAATCSDRLYEKPSATAAQLAVAAARVDRDRAGFLTPYADVDVAALSHAGLDAIIAHRLPAGMRWPARSGGHVRSNAAGTGAGRCSVAWPADGPAERRHADQPRARRRGLNTVVLNSGELPSSDGPYDNALDRTTAADGTDHVGAARRLGDHQPARVGVGRARRPGPVRRRPGLPRADRDDLARRRTWPRSLVIAPPRPGTRRAAEAGGAAVDHHVRAVAARPACPALAAAAARSCRQARRCRPAR